MQTRLVSLFTILMALYACSFSTDRSVDSDGSRNVEIREIGDSFELYVDGESYLFVYI